MLYVTVSGHIGHWILKFSLALLMKRSDILGIVLATVGREARVTPAAHPDFLERGVVQGDITAKDITPMIKKYLDAPKWEESTDMWKD